jgi:hypothetical protein
LANNKENILPGKLSFHIKKIYAIADAFIANATFSDLIPSDIELEISALHIKTAYFKCNIYRYKSFLIHTESITH